LNLDKIGITKEEYIVYKAIIDTPVDNITILAKKVGITRVTLYKILDSLKSKGLIKQTSISKAKFKYIAVSPDVLMDFVDKYQRESNSQLELLKKEITILKAMAGDDKDLDASSFLVIRGANTNEELDGLILNEKAQLYGFTYDYHVEACFKFDKDYRLEENDYLKVVMSCGDKFVFPGNTKSINTAKKVLKMNPFLKSKWEPRWIDPKKFNMKVNFYCFADKVAFALGSYKQKDFLAYVIKNAEIAESMRSLSIFLWENANKI